MIAIIDTDSIIYSCVFGNKVLDSEGNPLKQDNKFVYTDKTEQDVYKAIDNVMESIIKNTNSTHYLAYVKGKDTIKSRLAVNPEYKQSRPTESPVHYKIAKQYLIDKWGAIEVNSMEVDDAVNISYYKYEGNAIRVAIDKDILNLEGINYNWRKSQIIRVLHKDASYYLWKSMITGDPVDCIVGLKGKGDKFAEKLLLGEGMLTKNPKYFPSSVMSSYIEHFGDELLAIEAFYKNFKCLYILEKKEGFIVPEPIPTGIVIPEVKEELPDFEF